MAVHPASVLFITLDSCRFDTFAEADLPNLKAIGELHKAYAPGNFTYASHSAMFVGFTPGVPDSLEPYINPKFARIFRLSGGGRQGNHPPFFSLIGRDIISGFSRLGYRTVGTGSVSWFDTRTAVSRNLTRSFDSFLYTGNTFSFRRQREFLLEAVSSSPGRPLFAFANVGETHVPYWHEGADWDRTTSPCRSFDFEHNDAAESRRRQGACAEWLDGEIEPLLRAFDGANVVICADHGDAWGEDGLWEHGFHHWSVLQVPLLFRLQTPPPPSRRRALWESRAGSEAIRAAGFVRRRLAQ